MTTNCIVETRRRFICLATTLLLGVAAVASKASDESYKKASKEELCVMTYNLRYASSSRPNSWAERRPVTRECIQRVDPDVIGTQEGLYHQLKDIAKDQPDYEWIGLGRDGGSKGEFMAVFYKKDRFEPLEYDHFWLSDTPGLIASTSWGNSNRRMVTWVKFEDRKTSQQFYFVNTHLDHEIQVAREKAAQLIRDRILALSTNNLPIVLLGDFNAAAKQNPAYDVLVNPSAFSDTWYDAAERRGEMVHSFHNFKGPVKGDRRIDWILYRGPVTTRATEIITYSKDGQYPSDHFPVAAWITMKQGTKPD